MVNVSAHLAHELADRLDATVHEDYSGRGMFNKTCLGFSGHFSEIVFGLTLASVILENVGDAVDIEELANLRWETDNLGRSVIVYARDLHIED